MAARHTMRLYRLTPLDTSCIGWQLSRYCGDIVVRAENEGDAREEAVRALLRLPDSLPDGDIVFSPWGDRSVVACVATDASDDLPMPIDGEPGVVWPPGAAGSAHEHGDNLSSR